MDKELCKSIWSDDHRLRMEGADDGTGWSNPFSEMPKECLYGNAMLMIDQIL